MIIYIPLENIEQRYTKMMNAAIKPYANVSIEPMFCYCETIESGQFLDINKTSIYKAKQMEIIAKMFYASEIKDGDVFLVADIFFPGLESIRYMAELTGITVKIFGFNYAGRADKNDFVQRLSSWADSAEKSYHQICDKVFVGSRYHEKQVREYFKIKNVFTTGYIWDREYVDSIYKAGQDEKLDFIIFPHRLCAEKGVEELIAYSKTTSKKIIVTSSGNKVDIELPKNIEYRYNLTKQEYYKIMSRARWYLSCAHQETFGYTIQEAIHYGCIIAAPDRACCPEMLPAECIYVNTFEIDQILDRSKPVDAFYTEKWNDNVKSVLTLMSL